MTSSQAGHTATSAFTRAGPRKEALTTSGRVGFVARGIVYILIGVLAVQIAFGHGGAQADRQGALQQIASEPFGDTMLWILAVGFGCMTLWQAFTAVFGEDGEKKKGPRLVCAGSAVLYASVCWGTAAFAAGGGSQSGGDTKSRDWTATALKLPAGQVLVAIAGVVLFGVGVGIVVQALRRTFLKKLRTGEMGRRTEQVVTALGLGGTAARGVVFAAAGVFVLIAAVTFDPHKAKGIDATLRSFAHTPAGPWLLVLVAVGMMLFGLFSFASARWRRL